MSTFKESSDQYHSGSLSATEIEQSSTAAEPASAPSEQPVLAPGRVRTVSYRRLKNLGNFENEVVEVEGFVFGSESPAVVLDELRNWVFSQLGISTADMEWRKRELRTLDDQLWDYKNQRDQLKGAIDRMREWQATYGTKMLQDIGDPLPF